MPSFSHDGVEIAFLDEGEGEPIVLVHGFASNKEVNWVAPGWVSTLKRAGHRVIALDNRGHGASSKLYDPAAYHSAIMAEDVRALIDHLGLPRADAAEHGRAHMAGFGERKKDRVPRAHGIAHDVGMRQPEMIDQRAHVVGHDGAVIGGRIVKF